MAIAGALIGDAIGAFGKKPKVPTLAQISPTQVQQDTVAGNVKTLPEALKLGESVNQFNATQLKSMLEKAFPGATSKIEGVINSFLKGEIPTDAREALQRTQAERGVSSGTVGTGFNLGNELGSELGLSLQLMTQGLSSAEKWLSMTTVPTFDVTSMFLTPQQRLNFELIQQERKYARDVAAAGVEAAPDPGTAALGKEIDRFFNTVASVGMMAAGGGMGGGGVGGGMGGMLGGGGGGIGGGGGGAAGGTMGGPGPGPTQGSLYGDRTFYFGGQ